MTDDTYAITTSAKKYDDCAKAKSRGYEIRDYDLYELYKNDYKNQSMLALLLLALLFGFLRYAIGHASALGLLN